MQNATSTSDNTNERYITSVREHWITIVAPCMGSLLLLAISAFLFWLGGRNAAVGDPAAEAAFVTATLFLLASIHFFFHTILSERTTHIIVTDKRVIWIRQSLFLHDDMIEVPLNKVRTVTATKHGILQNILGYGSLSFDGGSEMRYISHPHRIAKHVMQTLEMK